MKEIKVNVQTMDGGGEREIETPRDFRVDEFVKELVVALCLTTTDAEGRPIVWRLDNKNIGRTLKPEHTL